MSLSFNILIISAVNLKNLNSRIFCLYVALLQKDYNIGRLKEKEIFEQLCLNICHK